MSNTDDIKKRFEDTGMKFNLWFEERTDDNIPSICPVCKLKVITYGVSWGYKQYGLPIKINTVGRKYMCKTCVLEYGLVSPDNKVRKKGITMLKMKGKL